VSTPLILPQIIVEAGLPGSAPVVPAGTLILDDAVNGKLDTGTLGGAPAWADISSYVKGFTISRPSTRLAGPLWQWQQATASILLDNSDGRFDVDNLSGPYTSGGVTQLTAMVPVRVRANFSAAYPLFSGFADGWLPAQVTYEGGYAELTLPATDGLKVLAGITIPAGGPAGAGEDTGARITRILNSAMWYTGTGYRDIDTGNSALQATSYGDTALNLMQIAVDSEIGQLYADGAGRVVFRARRSLLTDTRSATVQAVFGDSPGTSHTAGTELACAAIGRASDDTIIANDIQATRLAGTLQEVQDAASIATYLFPRSYIRSDLILQDDLTALNWAQWILYISKSGEDRFESLTIDPQADPVNLWPQCLGREIGDRIQIWHRPASVAAFSKDCFIAGITHTWDSVTQAWLTTWTLQDAAKYGSFLTLDNSILGRLDANALAFLRKGGQLNMMPGPYAPEGYTQQEIDRWADNRRPHEREQIPYIGERVLFRAEDFAVPDPALVRDVQDMTGAPHNHWHRHGALEEKRGPGLPDFNVWRWDEEHGRHVLKDDPWPWVQLQVILQDENGGDLRGEDGNLILAAPRWCREARVRGSCGWLREGSRAHTGNYEES
jgi:hypothetical protein